MNQEHPCASEWLALYDRFSIFPLNPAQKRPALRQWEHYQYLKASDEELSSWLNSGNYYNIGIVTGEVSGIVVLDLDSEDASAIADGFGLPATPEVKTPRGRHLYFAHPKWPVSNIVGRDGGKLPAGIDVRGDGGYVVGPPSHYIPTEKEKTDGKKEGSYEWVAGRTPDDLPFAPLPRWLVDAYADPGPAAPARPLPVKSVAPVTVSTSRQEAYGLSALEAECEAVRTAPAGARNHQLNSSAFAIAQLVAGAVLDEATARFELESAAAMSGLGKSEISSTLKSGWTAGLKQPRFMPEEDQCGEESSASPAVVGRLTEPLVWRSAADACLSQPKPREYLVQDWLPVGACTLLTGDGGTGKSLLTMQMASAISTGKPLWGLETVKAPVLAVYCEDDDDELNRRQQSINEAMSILPRNLAGCLWNSRFGKSSLLGHIDKSGAFVTNDLFAAIRDSALQLGARLVILDNINMVFGDDINNAGAVTRFMSALNGLALDINGAVLLIGHIAKAEGSRFAGAAAWSNASRNRLYFGRPENTAEASRNPDLRQLVRDKSNYARTGDKLDLMWERGAFVRPCDMATGSALTAEEAHDNRTFLGLLDEAISQKRPMSHKKQAGNYAPRVMAKNGRYKSADIERRMAHAMARLLSDGVIAEDQPLGFTKADRKEAYGLKRIDCGPVVKSEAIERPMPDHRIASLLPSNDVIAFPEPINQPAHHRQGDRVAAILDNMKVRGANH